MNPTQVNASRVTSINLSLANGMEDSLLKNFFSFYLGLRVLVKKLASPFRHSTQVSMQVQLVSTCDYLPVRLTWALNEVTRQEYTL